jgi:hypothetical protein
MFHSFAHHKASLKSFNTTISFHQIDCALMLTVAEYHNIVETFHILLVNARLPFIPVDFWYRRLPNNTAVLIVGINHRGRIIYYLYGINIVLLVTTADRLRLTTINTDGTRS